MLARGVEARSGTASVGIRSGIEVEEDDENAQDLARVVAGHWWHFSLGGMVIAPVLQAS